jgi:hypothetical protein
MESRYVDVFISHKKEDAERARDLKRRVENFGLTCWIDADDKEMQRLQEARPVDSKVLTDRVREHLRTCRCLIFAFSAKSRESRWMPWELGFFDGRWGQRLIGLYDLDESAKENLTPQKQSSDNQSGIGIPEFLQIYTELKTAKLEGFLQYVRSPRALADRADVDIDRWANLVAGIIRDPLNIAIDACQFWICYQQAFWSRAFGISVPNVSEPLLSFAEAVRTSLAPLAAMIRPASPSASEWMVQERSEETAVAQDESRARMAASPFAGILQPVAIGAVDHFVQLHHNASADAQHLSRAPQLPSIDNLFPWWRTLINAAQ